MRVALVRMEDGSHRLNWPPRTTSSSMAFRQAHLAGGPGSGLSPVGPRWTPVRLPAKTASYARWGGYAAPSRRKCGGAEEVRRLAARAAAAGTGLPCSRPWTTRPARTPTPPARRNHRTDGRTGRPSCCARSTARSRRWQRGGKPCSPSSPGRCAAGRSAQEQLIDVESHGREDIAGGPDVTRTVGGSHRCIRCAWRCPRTRT